MNDNETPTIITKEELAAKLNLIGRRDVMPLKLVNLARQNGLVIAYGESDDTLQLEGAISDEVGAGNRTMYYIKNGRPYSNPCRYFSAGDEECIHYNEWTRTANYIEVSYSEKPDDITWKIYSDMPFSPFDILGDGESKSIFCRAAVIDIRAGQ